MFRKNARRVPNRMQDLERHKAATRAALELLFDSTIPFAEKQNRITGYINPAQYIQHSPEVTDGLDGLMSLVQSFDRRYGIYSVDIKRLLAEADYTVAHCHYRFGHDDPNGKAIVEIFRFEDGLMVEHWDVIQTVTDVGAARNSNGMF